MTHFYRTNDKSRNVKQACQRLTRDYIGELVWQMDITSSYLETFWALLFKKVSVDVSANDSIDAQNFIYMTRLRTIKLFPLQKNAQGIQDI